MSLTRPDASQIFYDPDLTVRQRLERTIFPEQYGAAGDGVTVDSLTIQAALDAAGDDAIVEFKPGAIYQIDSTGLDFPAGCRVRTNGASFRIGSTSTTNAYLINVASGAQIDHLRLLVPTGIRRDRAIDITGDDISIGKIEVISTDEQPGAESNDNAVRFGTCNRLRIGYVRVEKYNRAVQLTSCADVSIGGMTITGYVRGLYVTNSTDVFVGKSRIAVASSVAAVTPGHNGVLLECDSHDATRNVTLADFTVEDAGEHGIRFGGTFRISNVTLARPHVKNSGASGIKLAGDDVGVAVNYHRRIYVTDAVIEDCGNNGANDCGIYFLLAVESIITNPIIRKENNAFSASYGIRVQACVDLMIVAPIIIEAEADGLWLDGDINSNDRVQIIGGVVRACGGDGLRITYAQGTHRRISTNGLTAEANTGYGCNVTINAGAGALSDAYIDMIFEANTAGSMACDSTQVQVRNRGGAVPAITCRNGSQWNDDTTLNYRAAGAWVAL